MWKNNEQFTINPPITVEYGGFICQFSDLSPEQWDEIGWNEAVPLVRDPYTTYETEWVKDEDLIYREQVISETVNMTKKNASQATAVRTKRDAVLGKTDWTQLADTTMDAEQTVLWQSYRQALRDIPQQPNFPHDIEWPEMPEVE